MKILIVSQYFWPENFRINDLAAGLKDKGHEVTVLTGLPNYPGGKFFPGYSLCVRKEHYNGITIKRVPLFPRGKSGKISLVLNYVSFVFSACILAPFYCRDKYDAIFVCALSPITAALPAIWLKKIKKTPLILWILDLWPESLSATNSIRSPFILKCMDNVVRFIYKHCDRILVASEGFISSVASRGGAQDKIAFLPNWAEDIYRPVQPQDVRLPFLPEELPQGFKLVFAGNIGAAQDFPTILAAFESLKEYKDIHLLVFGRGRMYDQVKAEIHARGLQGQVHLRGGYPAEDMPHIFSVADALLVTLKKEPIFSVTIPGKLQSYLACGRPVVGALDGEGAKLIRASGAGFVSPSGDAQALREVILKMYEASAAQREDMGAKGLRHCREHFCREALIARVMTVIRELKG